MTFIGFTKKSKGILSLDSAFAIAVIIFLTTYVTAKTEPLAAKSNESLLIDTIIQIAESAESFRASSINGYSSLSLTTLASLGYIPTNFSLVGGTPVGGTFTITNKGVAGFNLNASGNSAEVCNRVASKLNRFNSVTCSSGTIKFKIGTPTSGGFAGGFVDISTAG
jgi:hypothetical protein